MKSGGGVSQGQTADHQRSSIVSMDDDVLLKFLTRPADLVNIGKFQQREPHLTSSSEANNQGINETGKNILGHPQDNVPDFHAQPIDGASNPAFAHSQLRSSSKSRKSDSFLIGNNSRPQSWHPSLPQQKETVQTSHTKGSDSQHQMSAQVSAMKSNDATVMPWQTSLSQPTTGAGSLKSYASYNNVYSLHANNLSANIANFQRQTQQLDNSSKPIVSWGGMSTAKSVSSLPVSSASDLISPSRLKPGSVYANLSKESGIQFFPQSRGQEGGEDRTHDFVRSTSGNLLSSVNSSQRTDLKQSHSAGDMHKHISQGLHPPVLSKEFVKQNQSNSTNKNSSAADLNHSDKSQVLDVPPMPPMRDESSLRFGGLTARNEHSRSPSWSGQTDSQRPADRDSESFPASKDGATITENSQLSDRINSINNDSRNRSSLSDERSRIKSWDYNNSSKYSNTLVMDAHNWSNKTNFGNKNNHGLGDSKERLSDQQQPQYRQDTLHKARVAKVFQSPSPSGVSGSSPEGQFHPQSRDGSTSTHSHSFESPDLRNGSKNPSSQPSGNNTHKIIDLNSNGDSRLKNLYMESGYPFPKYDRDGRLHDDKNYNIPSPPERDVPYDNENKGKFSYSNVHHYEGDSANQVINNMSSSSNKLDDLLQRFANEIKQQSPEQMNNFSKAHVPHQRFDSDSSTPRHSATSSDLSAPWHSQTSSMSSGDSGPRTSYSVVRSPKNFTSVQHVAQSHGNQHTGYHYTARSKPYYNTGTQTEAFAESGQNLGCQSKQKNAEVQVDEDLMPHDSKSLQLSPSVQHSTTGKTFSFSDDDIGSAHNANKHIPTEVLQKEKRTRETMSEDNSLKKTLSVSNDIIAPINEYTSNQAPLLRKLSMEFYGSDRFGGSYTKLDSISRRDVPPIPEEQDRTDKTARYPSAWSNRSYEEINQAPRHHSDSTHDHMYRTKAQVDSRKDALNSDSSRHHSDSSSRTDAFDKAPRHFSESSRDSYKRESSDTSIDDTKDPMITTKSERLEKRLHSSKGRRSEQWIPRMADYEEIGKPRDTQPLQECGEPHLQRNKQVSLRKAYGIFDEVENFGDKRNLGKHGKSSSTSHVSQHVFRDANNAKVSEKVAPQSTGNYSDYTRLNQMYDLSDPASESARHKKPQPEKKLRRTSSEQFRPIKDRLKAGDKHKVSDPDSKDEKKHKTSDPLSSDHRKDRTQNPYERRMSDPKIHHRRAESDETFQRGQDPSSFEDSNTTGMKAERRHKNSDPELKKTQAQAVMSFFEMKMGKRLSSVSTTSDVSSHIPVSDVGSGSAVTVSSDDSTAHRERLIDDSTREVNHRISGWLDHPISAHKPEAVAKSRSMPRDMRLPVSESQIPDHKSSTSDGQDSSARPRSQSSGDSLSPSGSHINQKEHLWDLSREKQRSSSCSKEDPEWSMSGRSHQPRPHLMSKSSSGQVSSPEGATDSGDVDAEKQALRRSIDYSSSSSGSPSPSKTGVDFHKQYNYQVTFNEAYKSGDEEDDAPPNLPPRNYREESGSSAADSQSAQKSVKTSPEQAKAESTKVHKVTPEHSKALKVTPEHGKPQKVLQMELQPGVQETDLDQVLRMKRQQKMNNSLENSPKESNYADQLRQQSRRISQAHQPMMLNAARYQSKPIYEPKVSISTSQPVKKQPTPQEAHPAPAAPSGSETATTVRSEKIAVEQVKVPEHRVKVTYSHNVKKSSSAQEPSSPQSQNALLIKQEKSRRYSQQHPQNTVLVSREDEKTRRHSHHKFHQGAPVSSHSKPNNQEKQSQFTASEERSRRISQNLLLNVDKNDQRQRSLSALAQSPPPLLGQSDFAKSRALSVGSQDLTRSVQGDTPPRGAAHSLPQQKSGSSESPVADVDSSMEENLYEEVAVVTDNSNKNSSRLSPKSHDYYSQSSSPELPLPPPPKELHTRVEFTPHSTPLPPPPSAGQNGNKSGLLEEPVREPRKRLLLDEVCKLQQNVPYSKDSYMHFKNQNQPNRRVYGNYQRKSDSIVPSPPTSPTSSPYLLSLQSNSKTATTAPAKEQNQQSGSTDTSTDITDKLKIDERSRSPSNLSSVPSSSSGFHHQMEKASSLPAAISSSEMKNYRRESLPTSVNGSLSKNSHGNTKPYPSKLSNRDLKPGESPGVGKGSYHFGQGSADSSFGRDNTVTSAENRSRSPGAKVTDIKVSLLRRSNENLLEAAGRNSPLNLGSPLSRSRENLRSPLNRSRENLSSPLSRSTENLWSSLSRSQENISSARLSQLPRTDLHTRFDSSDSSKSDHSYNRKERPRPTKLSDRKTSESHLNSHKVKTNSDRVASAKKGKDSLTSNSSQSETEVAASHHKRQKSQEEIEFEEHAALLASKLKDEDRALSEVIHPPVELKSSTDYMDELFVMDADVSPTRSPAGRSDLRTQLSPASSSLWSGSGVICSPDLSTLDRQKEELRNRLNRKLEILQEERELLQREIQNNNKLGEKIGEIIEQKCENPSHVEKYRLLVDELDKVLHLLLMLSGRLAKAENAKLCLPESADAKQKDQLKTKCEELRGKLNDAKSLKEGIDRRSNMVAEFLPSYLSSEELVEYRQFVKMKTKLKMDLQEIDDEIVVGKDQLQALQKSIKLSAS